ncbi:hypothetical protein Poli38472_004585 [Pythium oligandrum]|uniref:glucan 1,3-beta-glucosidase n=1 Tax=Pythium oligandrum TaxID=41045 RepID=A0A8K1CAR1_PYTOL|nr:hypothetical protein Poli38472_004585 [Pythium oligandrum]|eukprot:TMW59516.1 hypothetical protein Poli38472_004585 [Pythium oligandrum]
MFHQLTRLAVAAASIFVAAAGHEQHNRTLRAAVEPANHIQHAIRAGSVRSRGVNLGGWLVSEQWMTQQATFWQNLESQYANKGEYIALAQGANRDWRLAQFENHHATFVMDKDIQEIANAGLNTVRVPVGFWITGADPFDPSGQGAWKVFPKDTLQRLDTLIRDYALKYNIAVMISLHAAKGSQNGEPHSAPPDVGRAYWSLYSENVDNSIYVVKFLADRYRNDAAFLGIGLMNEPMADTVESVLNNYYIRAYQAIRDTGNTCILSIMPLLYKQTPDNLVGFMERPAYYNVWVEWHPYFIWGFENWSAEDLVNNGIRRDFLNKMNQWNSRPNANPMFFGEWSLASSGQYTNPDSNDFLTWTRAQMDAMKTAKAGWTYWSWRIYGDENGFNGWSMRNVLRRGNIKSIIMS